MKENQLSYRMYFFVPYNISDIQKSIQSGHAALEYVLNFGRNDPDHIVWYFIHLHYNKTWIILDGGTTNSKRDLDGLAYGTLDQIGDSLLENKIDFSYFKEPDLNDAITAICFLADERVWNYVDYPNFLNYILDIKMHPEARDEMPAQNVVMLRMKTMEELIKAFPEWYPEWIGFLGGEKNVFLRELIKGKKLA